MAGEENILKDLYNVLNTARKVFQNQSFKFNNASFYGMLWNKAVSFLEGSSHIAVTPRELFLLLPIFYETVNNLEGTLAFFERDRQAWAEKVIQLFNANNEEGYLCQCYEFVIGSQLSDGKRIWFCNMNAQPGQGEQESLCEYYIEPSLLIECKNLFGVEKSAIDNNIRKANRQLRNSMGLMRQENMIGVSFINFPEKASPEDQLDIQEKLELAIARFRQCDKTHFLAVTFINFVTNFGGTSFYHFGKLICNPSIKENIYEMRLQLMQLYPRFRMVLIPHEDRVGCDVWDFVDDRRVPDQNIYELLFGEP